MDPDFYHSSIQTSTFQIEALEAQSHREIFHSTCPFGVLTTINRIAIITTIYRITIITTIDIITFVTTIDSDLGGVCGEPRRTRARRAAGPGYRYCYKRVATITTILLLLLTLLISFYL